MGDWLIGVNFWTQMSTEVLFEIGQHGLLIGVTKIKRFLCDKILKQFLKVQKSAGSIRKWLCPD
jgi:hypothetical protein